MRSLLKPTIRANTITALLFGAVLCMGIAPLMADEPVASGEEGKGTKSESLAPGTGKGEGVVNVPSMPEVNENQTGEFGANGCRVVTTPTPGSNGVVLQLPAEVPTAIASYMFQNVPVTTTMHEGSLQFDTGSLETLRAEEVEQVDIVLTAPEGRYVRVRLELPPNSDQVIVRIE